MSLSKNSSTRHPSHLSAVAVAVISINAALMSANSFAEDTTQLETLIVTGEKIDKDIKDTTTAVTIISGEDIEKGDVKTANEVATKTPNVTGAGFGSLNIRGVSGNGAATGGYALLTGARSRVSTVIDGTTQDWSGYNFTPSGVWDSEQVEVLRGPQSTTQGTSSMAGAVIIKTNDPTFEQESKIRVGIDRYKNGNLNTNAAAMNSGPINEDLAYRVAVDGSKGEGWMNYAQTTTELDDSPDVNDSKSLNLRGKLLWEPANNPKLSSKFTVEHHKYEGEYLNWANDFDTQTQTLLYRDSDGNSENTRLQDSEVNIIAADIDYELSEALSNSLHISYSEADIHFDQYPNDTVVDIKKETFTLENRVLFTPTDSNLSGVIGVFASSKDNNIDVEDALFNIGTTTTSALYGEGTYTLNQKTKLVTGLRIEHEKVERNSGYDYDNSNIEQNFSDTYTLPKIGIIYAATEATTLNASVRKGYSPGGVGFTWDSNRDIYTYDSEEVTTYEAGTKTRLQNGSTLNTSIFYNDYTGYQAFIDATYIDNIESAHTYGIEVEALTWATENLELRSSIGLLQSEVDSYTSYEGNELPSAPEMNLSLGFTQYVGDNWSFGADATYVGKYYSDLDNTEDYKAGDYTILNANMDYEIGNLLVSGYIKNLTDEDIVYVTNGSGSRAAVGQTRTIGLSATYRM
ncbi:TonB-dependent receptor [Marinomonas posidonica]|uniref:TonB-dependent receptor n=1 Tax=Marinomonas posidonica (strain CECT 7376 / NCIMB 14433 / IVIA-Po-181) TaxID=491952 RepID=F6CU79_MARPP|nr:TonB-dependent receptor [Marinomonas posidonica]AEF55198.1 TonB-dependent receptor [Marinomonas posidonica IVIA-Po-181]